MSDDYKQPLNEVRIIDADNNIGIKPEGEMFLEPLLLLNINEVLNPGLAEAALDHTLLHRPKAVDKIVRDLLLSNTTEAVAAIVTSTFHTTPGIQDRARNYVADPDYDSRIKKLTDIWKDGINFIIRKGNYADLHSMMASPYIQGLALERANIVKKVKDQREVLLKVIDDIPPEQKTIINHMGIRISLTAGSVDKLNGIPRDPFDRYSTDALAKFGNNSVSFNATMIYKSYVVEQEFDHICMVLVKATSYPAVLEAAESLHRGNPKLAKIMAKISNNSPYYKSSKDFKVTGLAAELLADIKALATSQTKIYRQEKPDISITEINRKLDNHMRSTGIDKLWEARKHADLDLQNIAYAITAKSDPKAAERLSQLMGLDLTNQNPEAVGNTGYKGKPKNTETEWLEFIKTAEELGYKPGKVTH